LRFHGAAAAAAAAAAAGLDLLLIIFPESSRRVLFIGSLSTTA
jgi:TRAP-type C4-dicarboxylate transport system permease small subunit